MPCDVFCGVLKFDAVACSWKVAERVLDSCFWSRNYSVLYADFHEEINISSV